jgi:hypothetical protein
MATQNQIRANRANALRSTGPTTPEGKQASSRNSTRHGVLSQTVVLEGESEDRFKDLLADFTTQLKPRSAAEAAILETMAIARWKQMRIRRNPGATRKRRGQERSARSAQRGERCFSCEAIAPRCLVRDVTRSSAGNQNDLPSKPAQTADLSSPQVILRNEPNFSAPLIPKRPVSRRKR